MSGVTRTAGKLVDLSLAPVRAVGDVLSPDTPRPLPPPPLPVTRETPEIDEAAARAMEAERRRKGRRQTILTSGAGVEDDLLGNIERPGARLLGG